MNKTSFFSLLLFIIIGLRTGFTQDYEQQLDLLMAELSKTTTGGTVLVAKDGKVLFRKAFGKANMEFGNIMKPHHIHRIGSITKQFTAAAILKLHEEGKLSLEDDIRKYIHDYPEQGNTITVEHLLTHTSGIANYTGMPKFNGKVRREDMTPLELIDFFKNEPMDFPPGEKFKYNNSGYIILGHIIEKVTGQTYAEYLKEKFFLPLGMKNTRYDSSSEILENRVPGYSWQDGKYHNTDFLSMTLPYAGGSLLSTVDDLMLWNQAIMEYSLLTKESVERAHSKFILKNGDSTDYGYGWRFGYVQESETIKHGGTVNGFTSFALYLPKEKIYVAILTNCDCTWNIETFASKIAAVALEQPYNFEEISLSAQRLKSHQGIYRLDNGEERIIRYEDGRLLFFKKGGQKSHLVPLEKDKYLLKGSLVVLKFNKGTNGFVMCGLDRPRKSEKTADKIIGFESISLSPKALQKYTGNYRLSEDRIFKVGSRDGRIFGQMGTNKEEILPLDRERFFAKEIDAQIIFSFDKAGGIVGLTIAQGEARKAIKIK